MHHLYFLGTLVSYALLCVALFNFSLPGAIVFGCASLIFTWLARHAATANIYIRADTHSHEHQHLHHHGGYGGPNPYLPDGTVSPFADAAAIRGWHAATGTPQPQIPASRDEHLEITRRIHVRERLEVSFEPAEIPPALAALMAGQQAQPRPAAPATTERFGGTLRPAPAGGNPVRAVAHQPVATAARNPGEAPRLEPPRSQHGRKNFATFLLAGPKK